MRKYQHISLCLGLLSCFCQSILSLYMCTSYLHTSMCTHAFVILITANIHIFTFSIDSQSLFFYLVFEHVLYFVYSFEGLMED